MAAPWGCEAENAGCVAFFDSGVGGLTVFEKLKKLLPNENYIYFGDTANMPYGEKTETQLLEFTRAAFDFFKAQKAKAAVMACNTTSAVVYEKVKDEYPFKIYPVIQSVAAGLGAGRRKLGVFATQATVNSGVYSREIRKHNPAPEVVEIACPDWVKLVEEGREDDAAVKKKLDEMLEHEPDRIILGCTHYPYLLPVLSKFAPEEIFIDPAQNFAELIAADVKRTAGETGSEKFYVSASPENFMKAGKMFCEIKELPELIGVCFGYMF